LKEIVNKAISSFFEIYNLKYTCYNVYMIESDYMSKKLTIGLFNDSFFRMMDGVVMVVDNYARELSKYANVIVFAPKYADNEYDDTKLPYKVVRCKSMNVSFLDYSLPLPKLDKKYMKELNNSKLDIVHIHSPFTVGRSGLEYAKKHNIPCVATMHSQFKKDFKRVVKFDFLANILNKSLINVFNKCDECFAVNSEVARIFYEDYKYKTLPKVMNNATEFEPVKDISKANHLINSKHKINKEDKVFLFVGRINLLKNILFIVDSLKLVKKKDPNLKFKMLFVGGGQDIDILKKHIIQNKLQKDIIICGKVLDREMLSYYYARSDLFLFPSLYDASSIVQIEAASQSTPGVFLKDSATAATVTDNINGFLAENNIEDYSNKIIEIMNNKKLYNKVSKNCFNDLYTNWDKKVKEMYTKYKQLINKE